MNRKKTIVMFVSAMLMLSSVAVYGTEISDFSDGREAQTEIQQELQTDENNSAIDIFQDEADTEPDTEFTDEIPEVSPTSETLTAEKVTDGNNVDSNGFEYKYLPESDTYCLIKGADIENVVIPYQYNGKVISEVGEKAFYGFSHIRIVKAELGDDRYINRIYIGQSAFENCANLRKIDFHEGAKIGNRAFYNCPKLWEYDGIFYYDSQDTEIEEDSFDPDTKLIFRAWDNGISKSVQDFSDKNRVFIEIVDHTDYVVTDTDGASYFDDWSSGDCKTFCVDCDDTMSAVRIWSVTEVIGRKAFYGCSNVRKVLIPEKTTTIESKAFTKCKNMSITIPAGVTFISEDAFEGASGITVYTDKGSYAEKYAKKHGLVCRRTPKPAEVPVPKLKVTYNSKYGDATLSWTPVDYTWLYYIYKYDDAARKYKRIGWTDQKTTSYKIDSPEGKTEKYKVCVRTAASIYTSQYSKKSNTVVVQGRPESSEIVSKKKKGKSIILKWTKSKGAQGYILYRYDKKAKKYVKLKIIKNGNTVTYIDKTGKLNKNDRYRVTAYCIIKDGTKLYGY